LSSVAITFLQHTDGTLPHYTNNTWNFARGATATIDRDLGFIDTHFFHDIIGTHVLHHLVSTIPFYHAGEASEAIKKVMGKHYRADTTTPFHYAFWKNQRDCKFVEESVEGSGILFFRNLHGAGAAPRDLTDGAAENVEVVGRTQAEWRSINNAVMATGKKEGSAKRRFSAATAPLSAKALPILSE
jgi:omega-6 fatty acid desaturase (delta-12 desaturase)